MRDRVFWLAWPRRAKVYFIFWLVMLTFSVMACFMGAPIHMWEFVVWAVSSLTGGFCLGRAHEQSGWLHERRRS